MARNNRVFVNLAIEDKWTKEDPFAPLGNEWISSRPWLRIAGESKERVISRRAGHGA